MEVFCTWWNRSEEDPSYGKLESTHSSRTSVKYDQGFLVSSHSCVIRASLHIRAATTSTSGFQRQQHTSGGIIRSSDLQIVVISSLQTVSSTAKLTHYSTMPHRPSDSSRPRQRLLLSGDLSWSVAAFCLFKYIIAEVVHLIWTF